MYSLGAVFLNVGLCLGKDGMGQVLSSGFHSLISVGFCLLTCSFECSK